MTLCALVIGHSAASPGAINLASGVQEFEFNDALAKQIEAQTRNVDVHRIYRRNYQQLPSDINATNPDFVIDLHCNAFNGRASGTEVLYYHRSTKGKQIAEITLTHLVTTLELPNRGSKAKTTEDRGGYLLRYTDSPCIIVEPFFIDNDADLARAYQRYDKLVLAYVTAIEAIAQVLFSVDVTPA